MIPAKELFAQIYGETLIEMLEVCRGAIGMDPECRDLIQLRYLVNEAMQLRKEEKEEKLVRKEFPIIYEEEEELTNEELMSKIEERLEEVDWSIY